MEILLSPVARKQKPVKIQARRAAPADRFRLKTILVPTDFSSLSQQAIRWAKFMAYPWKGNVHLVHVHDFEFAVPAEIAVDLISPVEVDLMLQEELISQKMIEAGLSEKEAMEISGHRTRAVFDRYHIVGERRLKEMAGKLEIHLKAKEKEKPEQETGNVN